MLLRREALKRGAHYVFEPNGPALRRLVQHAFEDVLNQLFVRGAFAGETRATSYQVVTDASINTPQSVELGRFRVDLKVAPSVPMSFVTVRLVQTGERGVATELV
jgi:phage tail sheath protein FI